MAKKSNIDKTYVQTPQEVIDFIFNSVDEICKENWGHGIDHEDCEVIDPFAGVGEFLMSKPKFRRTVATAIELDYKRALQCEENLRGKARVIHADTLALNPRVCPICYGEHPPDGDDNKVITK